MGQFREYNPLMVNGWHGVQFNRRDEDMRWETSQWGRQFQTWTGFKERCDEAINWCDGPMIHGRFACRSSNWSATFYFKSKRDAMAFKLAYGG